MKRIRNEQIQATVGNYLKRRHYMDIHTDLSGKKSDRRSTCIQSVEELALSSYVLKEGSNGNLIAYSSITGDAMACDQQFARITSFITEAVEPYRTDLQPLLKPLFIYIYLELLCNGQKAPAHKFYSRYQRLLQNCADYSTMMESLQKLFNKEDVMRNKDINEFRENKFHITLSEGALQYLFRYLKSEDNVLMLQLFTQHIEIRVRGCELRVDTERGEDKMSESLAPASPPITPENKVITSEVALSSLQNCIRQVRDGPPNISSVLFYSVNTNQNLCCTCLSPDQSLFCGGFEDSSLRLWSLTPNKLRNGEPCDVNISRVHLSIDVHEDIIEKNRVSDAEEKESVTLRGHSGAVYGASFTHDSQFILSCSEDSTVRLWEKKAYTCKVCFRGHTGPVWGIDTSRASDQFASCSYDRTVRLWCTDRVFPVRTFIGHLQDVDCVKFHPNSSYIATGSSDKTVRLWSVQDGKCVRLFHGHRATVSCLAFSSDGKFLASAGEDKKVKIWDLSAGTLLKDLKGHTDNVHALSFNKENSLLASGGLDCMLRMWDVRRTGTLTSTVDGHSSAELIAAFPTKSIILHHLQHADRNLLLASGAPLS